MEKKLLPYLVVLSAISISLSAAFYSVLGIGKMFSGASVSVMIMMSSLEIAKLILASLLYQYWDRFNVVLKTYYFISIFTLMCLTSAGIYGYLSAAYSETANKMEVIDKEVGVLDIKREMFQKGLNDVRSEKEKVSLQITELTKGLSNNVQQTVDSKGRYITSSSSQNRKSFESQLKSSRESLESLNQRELSLNDSIVKIDLQILDKETNTDIASELGPLKYISKITNKSIDTVVNWFILALMLVFDPLAVSLVVGANIIFSKRKEDAIQPAQESNVKDIEEVKEILPEEKDEVKDEVRESFIEDNHVVEENILEENIDLEQQKEVIELKEYLDGKISKNDLDYKLLELVELKENLAKKEKDLEFKLEDLKRLEKEISDWENQHWKLRRIPPPSAYNE